MSPWEMRNALFPDNRCFQVVKDFFDRLTDLRANAIAWD